MVDQLCTIAQVKARIFPAGVTDTADDTLLTELVNEISAWIQNYTGRKFVPDNAVTYVFDTVDGQTLRIPRGIRTITSMGVNATAHQPDTGGTYTTVPAADIILRPKTQDLPEGWPYFEVRITRATPTGTITRFARVDNGCTITGNFGFATVPSDIEAVAIDACVVGYSLRQNGVSGTVGADGYALPPWSQYFSKGSPQRGTLDRYAVPAF